MKYQIGDLLLGHEYGVNPGELCVISKIDFTRDEGERIWSKILAQLGNLNDYATAWAHSEFYDDHYNKVG